MIIALRLVHILAGLYWVGSVFYLATMLGPAIKAAGPAGGPVMAQLAKRRMPIVMMSAAFLTIGSGVWLMSLVSAGATAEWMRSSMGRTIAWGATAAILAVVLGMAINIPAMRRIGSINQAAGARGGAPTADEQVVLARLQTRLNAGTIVVATLLLIATAAMAVARYVP